MFRAIKHHATGTYYRNQRHGMLILNTKNKMPLLKYPNINRKDGRIHANMASDMTHSDMAGTTISRQVDELVPLTTEHTHGMTR